MYMLVEFSNVWLVSLVYYPWFTLFYRDGVLHGSSITDQFEVEAKIILLPPVSNHLKLTWLLVELTNSIYD